MLILVGTSNALALALHDGREVPFVAVVVIVAVTGPSIVKSAGSMNWLLHGEGVVLASSAVTFPVAK